MKIQNRGEIIEWLKLLYAAGKCIKRFNDFPLSEVKQIDIDQELSTLYSKFKNDPNDHNSYMFHKTRHLIKNLGRNKMLCPMVSIVENDRVDTPHPGFSRMLACQFLEMSHAPVDIICDKSFVVHDKLEHVIVDDIVKFESAFEVIDTTAYVQTCFDAPPYVLCTRSPYWKGEWWYMVNMENPTFWFEDDSEEWESMFGHRTFEDVRDYYQVTEVKDN